MPNLTGPLTIAELRGNLSDALNTVKYAELGWGLEITKHGEPHASLVSVKTATMLAEVVELAKAGRHAEIGNFVATLIPTKT